VLTTIVKQTELVGDINSKACKMQIVSCPSLPAIEAIRKEAFQEVSMIRKIEFSANDFIEWIKVTMTNG